MSSSQKSGSDSPKSGHLSRVDEITSILRDEILRGQYRPGERLPSERELSARFETNRGAIRESLKKLEEIGIASINPGGVRVIPIEEATLSVLHHVIDLQELPDAQLIQHLLEVLGALISLAGKKAVSTATKEQLGEMNIIVQTMIERPGDSELGQQNWRQLGMLFTEVSNNLVLRLILNGLKTHFIHRVLNVGPKIVLDEKSNLKILLQLKSALEQGNADDVAKAVTEHFNSIQQVVGEVLATRDPSLRRVHV